MPVLQELLNLGLVDIGSDDARFEKIQTASETVAAKLKEEPSLLIPATLIAIDDAVSAENPLFDTVEDIVANEWRTLRNTHANRPRELLRSVVIEAISSSSQLDSRVAAVVWNTAISPLRYGQVRSGKPTPVLEAILNNAFDRAERDAIARSGSGTVERPKAEHRPLVEGGIKISAPAGIKDDDVGIDVARAAGPQNAQGQALNDPNPHWSNQPQHWSYEFAKRMTAALVKAVNLGNQQLAASLSDQLKEVLSEIDTQFSQQLIELEQLQDHLSQTHESSRLRLDILWWSEATYSPLLKCGYRELPAPVAAVAAAVDLANIALPLSPASVTHILDALMRRVLPTAGDSKISVKGFFDAIARDDFRFDEHLTTGASTHARIALTAILADVSRGAKISGESIKDRTGLDPSLKLTPGELAMWIFRCIQADRLVETLR